ncbi:MAG: AtpZ/AtpI family protein [Marinirhabdus sp.]
MKVPKQSKNPQQGKIKNYARYSGIAFQMIAIIVLGAYGGVYLDGACPNRYSLFTISCSLLSVGIAMYFVVQQVKPGKADKEDR